MTRIIRPIPPIIYGWRQFAAWSLNRSERKLPNGVEVRKAGLECMSDLPSNQATDLTQSIDSRMVAGMRAVLAFAALMVIIIDPSEPDRYVTATYLSLSLYLAFSLLLAFFVFSGRTPFAGSFNNPYWVDVAWYLLLISLSSGTSSVFFFFFYFAILNASFLHGLRAGLKVTFVAAVGFSILGYLTTPEPRGFELDRFLIRPLSLLTLGYLISFWGGNQTKTLRRLKLLRDIGIRSNPRFGP